jgi:putative inorganic carbon (hco3(-)) transporter
LPHYLRIYFSENHVFITMRLAQQASRNGFFAGALIVLLSGLSAFLIATQGIFYGAAFIMICIAIPVAYHSIRDVKTGLVITFALSFTLSLLNRVFHLYKYPMGTLFDILIILMALGLLLKYKQEEGEGTSSRNVVGIMLTIWAVMNLMQLLNPSAPSKVGWFFGVKSNLYPIMYFFIFYYAVDSIKYVNIVIRVWFIIIFLAALYSFKQRYIGLASYENFVYTNELKRSLYITWGKLRVFSFMNDPMSYGITLTYSLILAFSFFFMGISTQKKIMCGIFFVVVLWSLLLTGTRTAYFLLPLGMVVFGLVTLNKKILGMVFVGMLIGTAVVITSDNPQLHIFKTAFRGSEDASMNVRLNNQQFIRPYIQRKPFGWGLASTGGFGRVYNGGTVVGNFPPDSEYVRIAIENGWIGLFAWLLIQFLIFRKGLIDYFKVSHPQVKIYFAVFLTLFYLIIVAQYPQEALRVPPTGIITGFVMAMLARMKDLKFSEADFA